ncbi:SDR family oxidoreductase [Herbaspirillum sp. NPDC087042]|uniref:SDR family oxidoreductase n=1 Tax=Herbaspirillum sp. NPDC087042 TaxID=3364004 RepID=UPI0038077263
MTINNTRVALVTGASRGIGAAIARRLARDGFSIVVNYAGSETAAKNLVEEIEEGGGRAISVQADVSSESAVINMFDKAEQVFGGVDVVVNNAGIMKQATVANFDLASFDQSMAINVRGAFLCMQQAARRVRAGGRIINLSTSVTPLRRETYGVYCATKSAVEALTAILSKEMRGRNVTVNAVAPGPTATELFLDGKSPELVEQLAKLNPLERLGTPEDIASAVSFVAGPEGSWINGQVLRSNGGMS